jgi:hypothetical protein
LLDYTTAEILRFALDRTVQGFAQNDGSGAIVRSLSGPDLAPPSCSSMVLI